MEIQVELDDEALCAGCPYNSDRMLCQGGFRRETARIVERRVESASAFLYSFGSDGDDSRMTLGFIPVRPLSCVLATEPVVKAAGHLPMKRSQEAKSKKVFVCNRCGAEHKNFQQCRFAK